METNETFNVSLGTVNSTDVIAMLGTNVVATVEIIDLDSKYIFLYICIIFNCIPSCDALGGMLPEPVTNLNVEVFTTNNSVLVQWTDTENNFDPDLIYYITVNVFARGFFLTSFSSNISAITSFSMSGGVFIVSGVVVDASVQASNNVGRGASVEANDTAPGGEWSSINYGL